MSITKPLCRLTEIKDTTEHIGSFLEAPDFANLCLASKNTLITFSKNKQFETMALLNAVFDADPEKVKKILGRTKNLKSKTCIALTKTQIKETYFSPKLNKTGVKRKWTNISPLEAAAWCGDIFLVRDLLLHVPATQKLEACKQLKGILQRKESEENGAYLAPFRALIKAYETYHGQFNTLYNTQKWYELKKLWNEVWQRQRSLPTYGLQEYLDDKPFNDDPPPLFTEPPKRSCYLYNDPKELLDLDSMDFGCALFKENREGGAKPGGAWRAPCWGLRFGDLEHAAISRLYSLRTTDLGNLIKELEGSKLLEESDLDDKDSSARP